MKSLVFSSVGTAILENEDGKALWSSDDDVDFSEHKPDEFLDDDDAEFIADYLVSIGLLYDDEEIDVESDLDAGEVVAGDDDDTDDEGHDDE